MGEIKAPRLIPKTKILKPASRRESFSPYKFSDRVTIPFIYQFFYKIKDSNLTTVG